MKSKVSKTAGSTSTPVSKNGTAELTILYNSNGQFQIASGTGLFTLTALTISSLKDLPGFPNLPLPVRALVQLLLSAQTCPGHSFSFRYMTAWYSKFHIIDTLQEISNLSREFYEYPYLIQTRLSSLGASKLRKAPGET